jgi:hypothetical protein
MTASSKAPPALPVLLAVPRPGPQEPGYAYRSLAPMVVQAPPSGRMRGPC